MLRKKKFRNPKLRSAAMSKGEHAAQRWQRIIKHKALTNDKRTLKQALEASLELEPAKGDKS